jgi:hypothetical protein
MTASTGRLRCWTVSRSCGSPRTSSINLINGARPSWPLIPASRIASAARRGLGDGARCGRVPQYPPRERDDIRPDRRCSASHCASGQLAHFRQFRAHRMAARFGAERFDKAARLADPVNLSRESGDQARQRLVGAWVRRTAWRSRPPRCDRLALVAEHRCSRAPADSALIRAAAELGGRAREAGTKFSVGSWRRTVYDKRHLRIRHF